MIRKYCIDDFLQVLSLFKLNAPKYFHQDEEDDLINYLQSEIEDYFVYCINNEVLGAGGINYHDKKATLSWDIIHPNYHGKGIGQNITNFRPDYIKKLMIYDTCVVRTSQFAFHFYEKFGFVTLEKHIDFWAEGFDMYFMEKSLTHNKT